ncbi:unnamed protein product [Pylaiella littoralis]
MSDDNEDIQLPIPSRTSGVYSGGVSSLRSGLGGGGRSSRKVLEGIRSASGRRLNLSSFATSNGSSKGLDGSNTAGSIAGGIDGVQGGVGKACTACGIQFTWRMRRHHCRACKQAVCDPCSKERLQIVGGDSKRHRVCHPCLKQHLATGRTREDWLVPSAPPSNRSSPFNSRDTSRNVSRDVSRHGPAGGGGGGTGKGLATYAEDQEPQEVPPVELQPAGTVAAATAALDQKETKDGGGGSGGRVIDSRESAGGAAGEVSATKNAAATAAAMAAAWSGNEAAAAAAAAAGVGTGAGAGPTEETPAGKQQHKLRASAPEFVSAAAVGGAAPAPLRGRQATGATTTAAVAVEPEVTVAVPPQQVAADTCGEVGPVEKGEVAVATALSVAVGVRAATAAAGGRQSRPRMGTGVQADPASHQHKRPVQSAKDQNPLALPWFTGKHSSPCSICEDLWKVAWSAREDFLRDLEQANGEKGYQLVASSGDNLRLYAPANMFWGGQAIRLRVEMEVAVPLGFAMRWLASLTARGGVYYPYSDTNPCDVVESYNGALSVACAHWPTNLSGNRRCTLLRYVSEDGSPPPGIEEDPSVAGKPKDPRPTIVFTTIEHPIMREWAQPGVDVEVFPSGLVLEEMESPAGAVTKVHGLIGWDNKGTLQHMAKMSYMAERADRLEGLAQHLRAMERGYLEYHTENVDSMADGPPAPLVAQPSIKQTPARSRRVKPAGTPGRRVSGGKASVSRGARGGTLSAGGGAVDGGTMANPSPGSPPIGFSPLPPNNVVELLSSGATVAAEAAAAAAAAAAAEDDYSFELDRRRMTSRAGPLSPNRGRGLTGAEELSGIHDGYDRDSQFIRRKSEAGLALRGSTDESASGGLRSGGGGRLSGVAGTGIHDWTPPPGHKSIPSPARAAELEAEVAFLNRQLAVRQSLEERLDASESDKARLITKLATVQADAGRQADALGAKLRAMTERLKVAEDQVISTRRQLGEAEERAMSAQRDLRLSHEALRVQFDANSSSSSSDARRGATHLNLSPGDASRFSQEMPLAASPALRAPPPISWGSGPSELLVGRTQEMGVKFALDTLRYSDDEEVVIFMLHLVQGLRHEALGPGTPRGTKVSVASRGGKSCCSSRFYELVCAVSSSGTPANSSSLARVLFQPSLSKSSASAGKSQKDKGGSGSGGGDGGGGAAVAEGELSQLALLLISRACDNEEVANFLFWYLKLEAEGDAALRPLYVRVRKALMENLAKNNAPFEAALKAAEAYVSSISAVHGIVKKKGGRAPAKTARLKDALVERRLHVVPSPGSGGKQGGRGKARNKGQRAAIIPLPLDPHTSVLGLRPATAYTFPSAMSPCVVEFVLSDSVGPSFKIDDLLLDPAEETPTMVTDINPADLMSWSGAGPLPRARLRASGLSSTMTKVVESVHVEAWEEDEESEAPTEESAVIVVDTAVIYEDGEKDEEEEDEDEEDESYLDRRRISVDAGSFKEYAADDAASSSAVKRHRDLSESAVDDEEEDKAKAKFKGISPSANTGNGSTKSGGKKTANAAGGPSPTATATGEVAAGAGGVGRKALPSLGRQASGDLTKLRLWEQMQVLGMASRERGSYLAIFKNGEDVRQDQLAVHMVSIMDRQLKEAGLDLKLKSYRVLATSLTTGMIEFVPGSVPMSAVLATHNNSVQEFLRYHNADPGGPLGMRREALDNFTRSCAGSCVVTYLLGVGDRHLDNLMLLPEGVLFHIDFGYLFGKDPKLMPPPFRLTKEMVEAMGGPDAPHYTVFKSLCCQAYRHLRKCAYQYLNLLSLMSGAGIKDLADDPAAVLQLVRDRFKLDLTDEQADAHFLGLVSQSMTALAPRVLEVMHQIRVAAR